MDHLVNFATAVIDADKAYSAAHDAAWGCKDATMKVQLDMEVRRTLKALVAARVAYETALDEIALDRRTPGHLVAAE